MTCARYYNAPSHMAGEELEACMLPTSNSSTPDASNFVLPTSNSSTPDAQTCPIRLVGTERPPRHLCAVRESSVAKRFPEFDDSERPKKIEEFLLENNAAAKCFWERRYKDLNAQEGEISPMPFSDVSEESSDHRLTGPA